MRKIRWGFQGGSQLPFFMMWEEEWHGGEVVYARVLYLQMGLEENP
jgi:hypothetical protein